MTKKKDTDKSANWSATAKVGAAVGSAALVAALLYAGRRNLTRKKGKLEPQSPPVHKVVADVPPVIKPTAKPKKVMVRAPKNAAAKTTASKKK
jgi:hypothetical protein